MNSHNLPYVTLARQLESLIFSGQLRSGEKLPPLRQLAERYQLKNNTVQRALKVLRDKGLITSIPGDGSYVAQTEYRQTAGQCRLTAIQHVSSDFDTVTYTSVALTGLQEAAIKLGVGLNVHYGILLDNRNDQLTTLLNRIGTDSDAIVMLGTFDFRMDSFDFCPCPVIGISMHENYRNKVSVISLDPFAAATLAVDYFHREGIKKVRTFVHQVDEQQVRLDCFRRLWDGELEIKEYASLEPIIPGDFPPNYPEEDGYWFAGGTLAEWHAKDFREKYHGPMAAKRKVIAVDGKSIFNPATYEPMNNIVPDWVLAGKLAVSESLRRISDPGSGALRQYLSVRFEAAPAIR